MASNLDYAVIGNCVASALISPSGAIVWHCLPRLDGDAVFNALLGGDTPAHGFFDIVLEDMAEATQRYRRNTPILETLLTDARGASVLVTDFLPRFKQHDRINRPASLFRRIEPLSGNPRVAVRVRPSLAYGRELPRRVPGSNNIRYLGETMGLRLTTDAPLSHVVEEVPFLLTRPADFVFGLDEPFAAPLASTFADALKRTEEYWHEWVRYLSIPYEWQEAVIRAAITLKLCAFEETGAIVAAMTTSIPEAPGTARTWDYRYCWLRDAYFTVNALNRLGATRTMEEFIQYIANVVALDPEGPLRPVYPVVAGLPMPEERIEPALAGFRGMGPVRVGNRAEDQVQHDAYGSVVLAAAQMFFDARLPRPGDDALFAQMEEIGRKAMVAVLQPDASLWEYRGQSGIHTYSAVMCWAACDRLATIAGLSGRPEHASSWRYQADRLRAEIQERTFDPSLNSFVSRIGTRDVDASLLLLPEIGFVGYDDPRFLSTLDIIEQRLLRGRHLLRYSESDDFGLPSTAFTICTFWYITALAGVGRRQEARTLFESLLQCRNHVGLLSEDIDFETGELWGNFPQTYSLVGLILTAQKLSQGWDTTPWGA